MSLASLVSSYLSPGTLYADAVAAGDGTAVIRMQSELAAAVSSEVLPVGSTVITAVWDRIIRVHAILFPQVRSLGALGVSGGHVIRQVDKARLLAISNLRHSLSSTLAQLQGKFPTAPGVLDPATAIAVGTVIWAVYEPDGYVNWKARIVEDNGEDPITIQALETYGEWPEATIPRYHVHLEYAPAQIDFGTAPYIDTLEVGDSLTDGVLTKVIASINPVTRLIVLTNTPSNITLTFEEAQADWTLV